MTAAAGAHGTAGGPTTPSPRDRRQRPRLRMVVRAWLDLTGMFRGAAGKFSQFRLILSLFAIQYARHWPRDWNGDAVAALAILVFALPVDALFARVPVSEALGALQAFFAAIGSKATEAYTRYRSRAVSYEAGAYSYEPSVPPGEASG